MYRFGVDYYPEHWPEERWTYDARLMQDAGINTVRLAEFAWSYLEPSPSNYEFEWLDRVLQVLKEHKIQAILGTPTASPPPWLMKRHPDAYRVRLSRQRAQYGGRRDYCPSHTAFLQECSAIVTAMAEHYAGHPDVIGWQVDNEFSRLCFCSSCQANFQSWLQDKYGSLDALNRAWGTGFWSHVYTEWSEIPLPEDDGDDPSYGPNPALDLDFRRFTSDAVVRFQQNQIDILRRLCPYHFITHNTGFGLDELNFNDIARPLDFISLDHYPRNFEFFEQHANPTTAAFFYDRVRGLKQKNYWMTEAQGGPSGWRTISTAPRPGELRLWTYQAIAHGADAMLYFRWRTALFGAEQYWHGVLDHHGQPRRRYREIQQIGTELERIGLEFQGAIHRSRVAILLSYDSLYAFQNQPNHPDFDYVGLLASFYELLHRRNISTDIIAPTTDLSSYQLVIAPALYVVTEEESENLRQYVKSGGMLILTARSGVKDANNNIVNQPLPGLLSELCGAEVDEYDVLPSEMSVPMQLQLPGSTVGSQSVRSRMWCDVLNPGTGQPVATYRGEYYANRCAATLNKHGNGQVLYLGTFGEKTLYETIIDWALERTNVEPVMSTPEGVEAAERFKDGCRLLFLLNHSDQDCKIALREAFSELVSGQTVQGAVMLEAKSVMILRSPDEWC
jgi:beta-galactosidase